MQENPEPIGHWIDIKRIIEPNGTLNEFSFENLPFKPARVYLIESCPEGTIRGRHAHRNATQLLVCLKGSVKIKLRAEVTRVVYCKAGGPGLLIPALVWSEQHYLEKDTMLLVFSSHPYDPNSYLHEGDIT